MGEYLIVKRGLYYRPNSQGYTGIKDNAGRYTLEEAQDHADEASGVAYVAEVDAPEFSPACYHDLALNHLRTKHEAALAALAEAVEIIRPLAIRYDNTDYKPEHGAVQVPTPWGIYAKASAFMAARETGE